MTTATVDARSIVQSFYANLAGGKPDAAFALCSNNIEWNEAEGNPLADRNPYRGAGQIAEGVFGRLAAIFEGFAAVPDEFIAENGRVIVIGRYHGTHRKSGAKLYCQAVHSWWVDGGKIVRFQQYADTAQLSRLSCRAFSDVPAHPGGPAAAAQIDPFSFSPWVSPIWA